MSGDSQQSSPPLIEQYTIAFEGNALGYIIYGIYVAVATTNLVLLRKKKNKTLFMFTLFQLVVTTLYNAIQLYSSPQEFLSAFNLAGGSTMSLLSPWPNVFINVAYVVNTWCSDAFLIYRCYVVLMGNKCAIAFPVLLYLVVVGSSIAYLTVSVNPSATYSTTTVRATALSYWSCSVALNVVASCIIAVRFWLLGRQIFRVSPQQGAFYVKYMAMTLESALLYTVIGIASLVVLVLNSPLEDVFFTVLGPVQVLAPALIVNRIARGISFESEVNSSSTVNSGLRYAAPEYPSIMPETNQETLFGSETTWESNDGGTKTPGGPRNDAMLYLYDTK